jgi:hypothetical protein
MALAIASVSTGFVLSSGACAASQKPDAVSPEGSASAGQKKLDCAFAKNPENCWRVFTAKLGACLGGKPVGSGKLSPDGELCLLPEEKAVKLDQPCDPDGKCDVRDLHIGRGENKCLEFHVTVEKPSTEMGRGVGEFSVQAAHGTFRMKWDEKSKTVTCADGTVYTGTGDWKGELADCNDETGIDGIPNYAITPYPGGMDGKKKRPGKVAFDLTSMDVLFECEKSDAPPSKK